jgi:hypothetical protein
MRSHTLLILPDALTQVLATARTDVEPLQEDSP